MPNWCVNLLEIAGPEEDLNNFKTKAEGEGTALSLANLIPYPDGIWNYDWCVATWGTKWDIDAELLNPNTWRNDSVLRYRFDSAWSPPTAAIEKLAEMYPTLGFCIMYAEPGVGFADTQTFLGVDSNTDPYGSSFPLTGNTSPVGLAYGYILGAEKDDNNV